MARKAILSAMVLLIVAACRAPGAGATQRTASPSSGRISPTPSGTSTVIPVATVSEDAAVASAADEDGYRELRERMVTTTITSRGVSDPRVLAAMRTVPRHAFVPADYLGQAYEDHPLPIGYGQTISQPYIVAWMTELLDLEPGEKVLEIGTGSGYQAAVLAALGDVEVYTIEIVPELAEMAAGRLATPGTTSVTTKQGDGYYGWPEHAPFDAIIVTAAPDHLPQSLAAQLADGGRLVVPIGPPGSYQRLWRFTYEGGELTAEDIGGVIFVPFTGEGISGE